MTIDQRQGTEEIREDVTVSDTVLFLAKFTYGAVRSFEAARRATGNKNTDGSKSNATERNDRLTQQKTKRNLQSETLAARQAARTAVFTAHGPFPSPIPSSFLSHFLSHFLSRFLSRFLSQFLPPFFPKKS